jgi:hypothetical protein
MPISRYRNTSIISGSYYETADLPKIDFSSIQTFSIVPTAEDRLDTLAFKFLGSGEYWWIIAMMNDIQWAFDFEPGKVIKIPVDVQDVLRLF